MKENETTRPEFNDAGVAVTFVALTELLEKLKKQKSRRLTDTIATREALAALTAVVPDRLREDLGLDESDIDKLRTDPKSFVSGAPAGS